MKRAVYNHLGQVIGELTFDEGTPEDVISMKLAKYAAPPNVNAVSVTAVQIRKALVAQGFTIDDIYGGLNSLPEPTKSLALIDWEYLTTIPRDHPLADVVANLLGWTSDHVDALWNQAAAL